MKETSSDRKFTDADWDGLLEQTKAKKVFASATCPLCGRTIREGAYGSRNSNFKRHVKACEDAKARAALRKARGAWPREGTR